LSFRAPDPYTPTVMPEGHTIHRAARDHARDFSGLLVKVSSPQGRFDAAALVDPTGRARLRRVEAYGKHLFYVFDPRRIVHVHLGLFGKFYRRRSPAPPPRPTTRMRLEGDAVTLDLVGPTACDVVTPKQMRALTERLGPDPLRADADPAPFFAYLARSKAPIGAVLLDQSRICGVGNVYRAEVLHLLRLHPDTPAMALRADQARELWRLLVGLLGRGVEERRIVTTHGLLLEKPRRRVPRAESTYVYGRRTCRTCEGDVRRYTLRARTVHYCRSCQPLAEAE
jgi:endonuclease-8